ncbi:hypothetical protein, conserved [Plasmodium gonderi]|uniref:RNA-editing substrate-binding complex 6 protein domain-containing protein n=1 Tax=Plasmodium gonderi TaxID=77519 RepID=A0A1Y1JGZ6_PLAGO|nr:hypothetical protein, conserved [Plasmodium gonderi]GAW80487.1 hypothetical protein, conserved [Plasmodium gonderi]
MTKCGMRRKERNVFFFWYHKRSVFVPSQKDVAKLSSKSLGNYAFDILRLSNENKGIYEVFKKRVKNEINSFDAKDCYRILKSLEINNKLNEEEDMIKNILHQISVQTCKYSIKEICDISFLCAKLNLIYIPLYASLSISFLNKINLATPQNLSILCLSFCKVQIKDVNLFNRITIATMNILHMFDVENLLNVLISFAYLDMKKDMLLHSSIDIFVKNQNKLNAEQVIKIAHVYSKFGFVNKDINSILEDKLPSLIPHLGNVQLADLIISLKKLGIHSHTINNFFTKVNLPQLTFSVAIKVINILSSINNINIEFMYDQILFCVKNFLRTHGKKSYLNGKVSDNFLQNLKKSYHIKNNSTNILKTESSSKTFVKKDNEDVNVPPIKDEWGKQILLNRFVGEYNPFEDTKNSSELFHGQFLDNNLEEAHLCGNEIENANFSEEELNNYYMQHNFKKKLTPNFVCYLSVDIFEGLVNLLLQNCVNEYEKMLKKILNCISKEIIFLKEYINFNSLITIFLSLRKMPIIWNLSLLNMSILNSRKVKENCIFYIDQDNDFYEQLVKRYFSIFHTSENVDNHSLILCFIINLVNDEMKQKYGNLFKKSLQHYALIRTRCKNQQIGYPIEDQSVYNFVEYCYKSITLWERNRIYFGEDADIATTEVDVMTEKDSHAPYTYPYDMRNTESNRILTLELFGIVYNFTKNLKISFKDDIYTISLLEYDNYIAYMFLEPSDFFYSSTQASELDSVMSQFMNTKLRGEVNAQRETIDGHIKLDETSTEQEKLKMRNIQQGEKNKLLLICDMLYNPYEIFYNDNYFIKSEVLIKINYFLIKGYYIIAIPFYSWRCMTYEDKVRSISANRKNLLHRAR